MNRLEQTAEAINQAVKAIDPTSDYGEAGKGVPGADLIAKLATALVKVEAELRASRPPQPVETSKPHPAPRIP